MMRRLSAENHSFLSRITNLIFSMKCYSFFIMCLVVLFGIVLALPSDVNLPFLLKREIERVTIKLKSAKDDVMFNISNSVACSTNPEEELTTVSNNMLS